MRIGGRLQKRYSYSLPSSISAQRQERIDLHSGMSCYKLESQLEFTAQSAENSKAVAGFFKELPVDNTADHFFDDYNDIIPADDEKIKRLAILDELSAHVEKTCKKIKEHGLYYNFTNDKNLLFNYQKGIFQLEQQFSTAVEFYSAVNIHNNVYQNSDLLLDETELLDYTLEELKNKLDIIIEQHFKIPDAKVPQTGEYTIILNHNAASVFVHESVGHLFEEDNFRQQTIFNEETVINPHITVTDYAHTAFGKPCLLPLHIDSEGTETIDVTLIKNGKIQNRMNNRQFAVEGICTGNSRSSLFSQLSQIRMRNTALEVDKSLLADLSKIDNALVVEKINAGSSEQNGEVELFVEFGHEIKKGEITGCVRNFVIRGHTLDLLNSITACSDDFTWHSGNCGKNGYGLRLTHGAPSIVLKGTVHGC
ncbi:MAG: TldD/PmbA family protein [Treponema sp.]|jgi:TldD protein|nr:TldD/PmbA family protein [Treponema sp.]